jgi:uncharacterized damage-inducible protein DinB/predicted RNase H-like HicB family nuclease
MSRLAVYLEIGDDGRCMAHVPELPGCFVRASSRDQALKLVPATIRNHYAWLRCHGEPAPPEEAPFGVKVAGEVSGVGSFDPGSAAALFPPDQGEIVPEEMARYFRLMAHSRADLLALVRDLPDEVLDWQREGAFSIRRLLRHVGDAEEWYVSRIVSHGTLPPEWEHDADLPVFEFLEMERRTALERLQQLTRTERTKVFYPSRWTDHPEEPWTARKVLRRFLEHEREHTGQAQEILLAWWEAAGRRVAPYLRGMDVAGRAGPCGRLGVGGRRWAALYGCRSIAAGRAYREYRRLESGSL